MFATVCERAANRCEPDFPANIAPPERVEIALPFSVNGIGTSVCPSIGDTKWPTGTQADSDGFECFIFIGIPVIPYASVHTFLWNGTQYQKIPIRWSWKSILCLYARYWLGYAILFLGVALMILSLFFIKGMDHSLWTAVQLFSLGAGVALVSALTFTILGYIDHRTRCIRRALGQHALGSSDPADWTSHTLRSIRPARDQFGTDTYAAAVEPLLRQEHFSGAMWAARLCAAVEDPVEGERLTDQILDHASFQESLQEVGKNGEYWLEMMGAATEPRVQQP